MIKPECYICGDELPSVDNRDTLINLLFNAHWYVLPDMKELRTAQKNAELYVCHDCMEQLNHESLEHCGLANAVFLMREINNAFLDMLVAVNETAKD